MTAAAVMLSSCASPKASASANPYEGEWKSISYNSCGIRKSNEELGDSALVINPDGSGTFAMMSSSDDPITWKKDGQEIVLSCGQMDLDGIMNGNVLTVELADDMEIFLTKDGEEAKWAAEPTLLQAVASASPEAEESADVNLWYGSYIGTFIAGSPSGGMGDQYDSEKDPIYGTINTDGTDYLELYFDETHDEQTDPILLSTYVSLGKDHLTAAGTDDWLLDMPFTADNAPFESAVMTDTYPVTIVMSGTYQSPNQKETETDSFNWTIALTRTEPLVSTVDDSTAPSGLAALGTYSVVSGSKNAAVAAAASNDFLDNPLYLWNHFTLEEINGAQLHDVITQNNDVVLMVYDNSNDPETIRQQDRNLRISSTQYSNIKYLKMNQLNSTGALHPYWKLDSPCLYFFHEGKLYTKINGYVRRDVMDNTSNQMLRSW